MKKDIHPEYITCTVSCACGNKFDTRSTKEELRIEICGACHPFYTGQDRFVDSAGRIDRFLSRYKDYKIAGTSS